MTLDERVALVAGDVDGVGRSVGLELARRGVTIAVLDADEQRAAESSRLIQEAGALRCSYFLCDVADPGQVEQAVAAVLATFDRIDILVNIATAAQGHDFLDDPAEEVEEEVGAKLAGILALSQAVLRHMAARGYGKVVNVALDAAAPAPLYGALRGAVVGLTRTLAREFAPQSINVNCVCPGPTESPARRELEEREPERARAYLEGIPMKRAARPEEVASAVAFLASGQAGYVTGITLGVNGGATGDP